MEQNSIVHLFLVSTQITLHAAGSIACSGLSRHSILFRPLSLYFIVLFRVLCFYTFVELTAFSCRDLLGCDAM